MLDDEEQTPKPPKLDLATLSIEELHDRIAELHAEIARLQAAIEHKQHARGAADSVFGGGIS